MRGSEMKNEQDFYQLFSAMIHSREVEQKAITYLRNKKKIGKAVIYDELLAKKLIGYASERKALAFPLVRGFLYVGIQYVPIETLNIDGHVREEGQEYCHEGSDLETGLFTLQKNFRDAIITYGILDLLSTGLEGVSLPSLTSFKQLHLFSNLSATVCLKNTEGRESAIEGILEILPKATIVTLPKQFRDINHLLIQKGPGGVNSILGNRGKTDMMRESKELKGDKTFYRVTSHYFTNPGPDNTQATLEAARERAKKLRIKKIVISTCSGKTAFRAIDLFGKGFSLVIVTHATGFKKPDYQELAENDRQRLLKKGVSVLTAQHAFGGVGRAFRNKTGTYQIDELIAYTLRTFGQGTKVAIEIALMAADAGLIRTDENIISIGGTANGVDTALLLKPAHTQNFLDLKVREIICKPADF
jgi:hypothetical protein